MSELKVETIKPAFGNKVTVSPGFLVTDSLEVSKFEITTQGTVAIMGPLYVGTSISKSAGTAGQLLVSQGAGSPPVWGGGFPIGGIIMWSGTVAPAGWAICNGQNGTPNLTDRFIVGAGSSYSVTNSGGSKDAVVVQHSHTGTDDGSFAAHRHQYLLDDNTQGYEPSVDNIRIGGCINNGGANGGGCLVSDLTSKPKNAANASIPSLGIITSSNGVSGTNANLPPYYALYYIMKIS